MQFVNSVVVIESDDWIISAGDAVMEGVLDAVWKLLGLGHRKYADTGDSTVRIGFNLVTNNCDVITRPCLLV